MSEEMKAGVPGLGINVQAVIGEGPSATQVVFQTVIPGDSSEYDMNRALDKYRKALERQRAIVDIPNVEKQLKNNREGLINLRKEANKIDLLAQKAGSAGGRSGAPKMNEADAQKREKMAVDEKRYLILIPELEARLETALEYLQNDTKKAMKAVKSA